MPRARRLGRGDGGLRAVRAERRGDAGEMQQVDARQQRLPIEIPGAGKREAAPLAVVDDVRSPEARTRREEIEAHPTRPGRHAVGCDAVAAQMAQRRLAERIAGQAADHRRVVPEPGEADRDIGFGTADMDVEPPRLQQQFAPRGGQPQQQFAETGNPSHRLTVPGMGRAGNCLASGRGEALGRGAELAADRNLGTRE